MNRKAKNTANGVAVMVCLTVIGLLWAAATAFAASEPAAAPAQAAAEIVTTGIPAKADMDTLTTIFTRRSVRKYSAQPVSDATVKLLLQAAMSAPTAKNTQDWEFIVIRDKNTLAQIPGFHPFAKQIPTAQVAIVVCGNTKLEAAKGHWIPDASNASMNILLAAHSLGLGAVWTTFYPYEDRTAGIRKLLGLPDHIMPLNIIPLGYPVEKRAYQDRFNPAKVHYEKW